MAVKTFDPHTAARPQITLTAAAAEHLRAQLARSGRKGLRLYLRRAGCTGYVYELEEVNAPGADDLVAEGAGDVLLCVPARDLAMLNGTKIDYRRDGLNWKLEFHNPNARDVCGCGESVRFGEVEEG